MLTMQVKTPKKGSVGAKILRQFEEAEREALEAVKPAIRTVLVTTLGTQYYSLSALRRMKHPYSAERPNPPMPAGVINKQSGRFFDSIVVTDPARVGKQVTMVVFASDQERVDLLMSGESMMVRNYKPLVQARMRRAVDKALGEAFRSLVKVKVKG